MSRSAEIRERAGASAGLLQYANIGRWLPLAAAPTFAIMALLTARDSAADMICSAQGTSIFSGMAPMYLLMSVFHARPWLKLLVREETARRP